MKTETLKPWVEFIEEIENYVHESRNYKRGCELMFERKDFFKETPKLGDFIPTNKKGEVLEEPELTMRQGDGQVYYDAEEEDFIEYQQAQERVKFEGWRVFKGSAWVDISDGENYIQFWKDRKGKVSFIRHNVDGGRYKTINTYSDLTGYGLKMIIK